MAERQIAVDRLLKAGDTVDVDDLALALDEGTYRATVSRQYAEARSAGVPCSGTVTLPDGTMLCNPGTEVRWVGGFPAGTPVLDSDLPSTYDAIVAAALGAPAIEGLEAPAP
jgi:hypothetical protein